MLALSSFELDEAAVSALFSQGGMVWLHVNGLVVRVTALSKSYAPVRTGRLRSSIIGAATKTGPFAVTGLVGSTLDYAVWVHEGTRPHTIRPKAGHTFVTFTIGGRKYTANQINHPGTKGTPFLRRALEEVMVSQL